MAVFYRLALFHHDNLLLAALFDHFQGGEDAGRTGADDHRALFHFRSSVLRVRIWTEAFGPDVLVRRLFDDSTFSFTVREHHIYNIAE